LKSYILLVFVLLTGVIAAQIKHPKTSPAATIEQEVGLAKIIVTYSRPAVRGRKIFGDLVPYGRIWRVGANASTKITVDTEMKVMGNTLPAGTYALYAFPNADTWQIAFHTNTEHWGDGRKAYNPKEDLFRITLTPALVDEKQENFLITFDRIQHTSVNMILAWDTTRVSIPITVDTHSLMLAEIEEQLSNNPTAQSYYEAARYLQEEETQYKRALKYLNKAIALGGDTYYFYRVKSLVEAALGDYSNALISANKSLNLAHELGKDEFVRMNAKNIKRWKNRIKKRP